MLLTHNVVVPRIGAGNGLTVIVKLCGILYPFADGVTVIVAVTADELAFVATNDAMFPEPECSKTYARSSIRPCVGSSCYRTR